MISTSSRSASACQFLELRLKEACDIYIAEGFISDDGEEDRPLTEEEERRKRHDPVVKEEASGGEDTNEIQREGLYPLTVIHELIADDELSAGNLEPSGNHDPSGNVEPCLEWSPDPSGNGTPHHPSGNPPEKISHINDDDPNRSAAEGIMPPEGREFEPGKHLISDVEAD